MTVLQTEQSHLPAVFVVQIHDLRNGFAHLFQQRRIFDDFGGAVIAQELSLIDGRFLEPV